MANQSKIYFLGVDVVPERQECCVCLEEKQEYNYENRSVTCWTCKAFVCEQCVHGDHQDSNKGVMKSHTELTPANIFRDKDTGIPMLMTTNHWKCPCCRAEWSDPFIQPRENFAWNFALSMGWDDRGGDYDRTRAVFYRNGRNERSIADCDDALASIIEDERIVW